MTIVHAVQGKTILVALRGELDLKTADPLREALDALVDRYSDKHLTIDLTDVEFIDSSGLGVLLGRYRRLKPAGRHLSLTGVRPAVRSVLELAGLDAIISITDAPKGRSESITP